VPFVGETPILETANERESLEYTYGFRDLVMVVLAEWLCVPRNFGGRSIGILMKAIN